MESWIEAEITGCTLLDERLKTRLRTLLSSMSQHVGEPLPLACQDGAATKAAYRFFDNENVDESAILAGHFEATRARFQACSDAVLVLHDTTEFSYTRTSKHPIGYTTVSFGGWDKDGRARHLADGPAQGRHALPVGGLPLPAAANGFLGGPARRARSWRIRRGYGQQPPGPTLLLEPELRHQPRPLDHPGPCGNALVESVHVY